MADRPGATPPPPWLLRLRQALFATPGWAQEDDHFLWEGETYVCQRALIDDGRHIQWRETWLEPRTLQAVKTWRCALDTPSWVGPIPELVFQQQLASLLRALEQARPRKPVRQERRELDLYRFARRPGGGQPR